MIPIAPVSSPIRTVAAVAVTGAGRVDLMTKVFVVNVAGFDAQGAPLEQYALTISNERCQGLRVPVGGDPLGPVLQVWDDDAHPGAFDALTLALQSDYSPATIETFLVASALFPPAPTP